MPTFYSLPVAGAMNEMIERIADVNGSVAPNAYSMRPIQPKPSPRSPSSAASGMVPAIVEIIPDRRSMRRIA